MLDILINNAGHFKHGETSFQESAEGLELTFATNLFGPVLLTSLLLDVLVKSNDPRVLNACSTNIKHFFDERRKIDIKALCGERVAGKKYDSYNKRYFGVTGKLMNHLGQIVQVADQSISFVKIMRGLEYYPHYVEDKETYKRVWAECNRFIEINSVFNGESING